MSERIQSDRVFSNGIENKCVPGAILIRGECAVGKYICMCWGLFADRTCRKAENPTDERDWNLFQGSVNREDGGCQAFISWWWAVEWSVVNFGDMGYVFTSKNTYTLGGNPSWNVGLSTKMTGANKLSEVSQVTQARSLHALEPESRVTTTSDLRQSFVWWQWIHGGSNSLLQNNYYKKVN